MIDLKTVTVRYGENTVYEEFNFTFQKGVNVVLGRSGCGKTTLLNVVADLVKYDGECVKDGGVALVFQEPCLAPVSVWKNVDLVLPKSGNANSIEQTLQAVGLSDKRNQKATTLSGGEQQRVSLARAFAANREILLMDEPFSNLDYGVKVQLRKVLDDLLVAAPKTVLFVTHDIDDAVMLADRIYLLDGRPAKLTQVAEIDVPRSARTDTDTQSLEIKKLLQQLLSNTQLDEDVQNAKTTPNNN